MISASESVTFRADGKIQILRHDIFVESRGGKEGGWEKGAHGERGDAGEKVG